MRITESVVIAELPEATRRGGVPDIVAAIEEARAAVTVAEIVEKICAVIERDGRVTNAML